MKVGKIRSGLKVRNEQERQAVEILTAAHKALNEELGLNTELVFSRECNWGKDARHAGWYLGRMNLINLNFRNMYGASIMELLEVLGHEMRHAVQNANGWHTLSDSGRGGNRNRMIRGTWKGETMYVPYYDSPWEVDARDHEAKYAWMAIDLLGLDNAMLEDTRLPMGSLSESDILATRRMLEAEYPGGLEFLAKGWIKDSSRRKGAGIVFVLKADLIEGFNFKNREHATWLYNNQELIHFQPAIKVSKPWGGFSVREMCS